MDNKELLEKIVLKAQEGGYIVPTSGILWDIFEAHQYDMTIVPLVIFSHEFAKAFFGEEITEFVLNDFGADIRTESLYLDDDIIYVSQYLPCWKYHLSKMVLCEEPLKYLEKFIKE